MQLSRMNAIQANAVRSLVTGTLHRRMEKANVQCTVEKGKPCSFLMKQCNDFDAKEHMTLYCFALYMKDTGVTKTSSELEPL